MKPLNYATPGAADAAAPRHPRVVTLLMLVGVIAFFAAGAWGLLCIDVLGAVAGGLMIASAVLFMIVVFGFLSRPRPQYVAGAIMTFAALAAVGLAMLLTHAFVVKLEERILYQRKAAVGSVIVVSSASDVGQMLGTLQAARFVAAAATFLAFSLLVYLSVRSFQSRSVKGYNPPQA
jgi:hypothetical protein